MKLAELVFQSSVLEFKLQPGVEPKLAQAWPMTASSGGLRFSYFSYSRIIELHRAEGIEPRLEWSERILEEARRSRRRFPGRLICAHLKRVAPYQVEESNAEIPEWREFLARNAKPGEHDFMILGDDEVGDEILAIPGVFSARRMGMGLAEQLAGVGLADGFIAMGSGICAAANFSATPYVIFKHPAHHGREMESELAGGDRFPFAQARQRLWRRQATTEALEDGLRLILS
ncbi:MAG: hypothetical protein RL077_2284 [Verrucomicrobiota bacterium]